jgi:hypothetical protein
MQKKTRAVNFQGRISTLPLFQLAELSSSQCWLSGGDLNQWRQPQMILATKNVGAVD